MLAIGGLPVVVLSVGDNRLPGLGHGDARGYDRERAGRIGRRRAGPLTPPGYSGGDQAEQSEPRAEQDEAEPASGQHKPDQD